MKNELDIFSNGTVLLLLIVMVVLLFVIAMLGSVLYGLAQVKYQREKNDKAITTTLLLLLAGTALQAQDTAAVNTGIAGISYTSFYALVFVLGIELLIIVTLLLQIRLMLAKEKPETSRKPGHSFHAWWQKLNALKPIEQEADLLLDHHYDGIRELDNRLPPWWLYGFYCTILFAFVYFWRAEVSHAAPSSKEEYVAAVEKAKKDVAAYLALKGESVDENSVELLTDPTEIAAGKTNFIKSCAACHTETGAGAVGPNLTDEYWLHGGDIKSIFKTIRYGINAMPSWQNTYSNKQIAQMASFVESLKGTHPANAKAPQGNLYQPAGK